MAFTLYGVVLAILLKVLSNVVRLNSVTYVPLDVDSNTYMIICIGFAHQANHEKRNNY